MKTIGLLGGMSWESTAIYYKKINEIIRQQLGGLHSAKVLLYSFDFEEIAKMQTHGDWQQAAAVLSDAALILEGAGADAVLICSNTMHMVYPQLAEALKIPVIHIADPTAAAIQQRGLKKVGLLATRFTMEQDFYIQRFKNHYQIEVIVPGHDDRRLVHDIIYDELCKGIVNDTSMHQYVHIIQKLIDSGAQAIVLGCTEIGMLINQTNVAVPVFDTTYLHAQAAVKFCLI
ncbi:aspartate/glutamate racemase family protein [Dyadobacter flavalbus]|uniref:Aspartate/glutamate racemase family protein n=1 Tax=Dyadobacter flavalbus TaxID=2579942 RepID=A0A5M8QRN6_9BACT|nr:aspartate/glutamate racemase family protein [Dyadobacter flavalbus]KAA6438917.1 aspartate/glutamate racemase family protein [Dyadobacter flavalbus]